MTFPWKNLPLQEFTSSDNATLFYYKRLAKNKCLGTLLFLCGWSQGPNNWSPSLLTNAHVKDNYDVYVLVMRGFKNVEDNFNNNVARYAQDVVEFIKSKKLKKVTAVGHSMGASVCLYVISLYGEKYFDAYVFIDHSLQVLKNPDKFGSSLDNYGSTLSSNDLFSIYNTSGESASNFAEKQNSLQQTWLTPQFIAANPNTYIKILAGALGYNYKVATEILFNHACNNYEQILKNKVKKPALLIGGKVSTVPFETVQFQEDFYEVPTVKIFEENEGGSHSMYLENYELFNKTLNDFLQVNNNKLLIGQRMIRNRINKGLKNAEKAVKNAIIKAITE
jgi:pimeloyl-ACP methyl ester carboxylesterase